LGESSAEYEFAAYALDCRITARIRVADARILDVLNESTAIELRDVLVEALDDGHRVSLPSLSVGRDELLGVAMVGPRGAEARRRATRTVPAAIRIGPYRVWGLVHSMLSADAMSPLHGHRPMVPLTRATIVYDLAGIQRVEELPGLIVNRGEIDHVN